MSLEIKGDSLHYVSEIANAHGITRQEALDKIVKHGFSRVNALTRHAQGQGSKNWPAPGRKVKPTPKKAKKASRKRGPTEVSPETIAKRKAKVAKQIAKEKAGA